MNDNKMQNMSSEALLKQQKSTAAVTGFLAGILTVLLIVCLFSCYKQGFTPMIFVPFGLLPIVFLNWNHLKVIKKELTSRNEVM